MRHVGSSPKLTQTVGDMIFTGASKLLYVDGQRKRLVDFGTARLRAGSRGMPRLRLNGQSMGREQRLIILAVLHTIGRLMESPFLAPEITDVIARLWGRALYFALPSRRPPIARRFLVEHGCDPPWFMTISPEGACNLRCTGCYASSAPDVLAHEARVTWAVLDSIRAEAQELSGVGLLVFSVGEPLLYRSQGQDLLDAVDNHGTCLYLMFTNGTLIDRALAGRLTYLGNLTLVSCVEGVRSRTDARREKRGLRPGPGVDGLPA